MTYGNLGGLIQKAAPFFSRMVLFGRTVSGCRRLALRGSVLAATAVLIVGSLGCSSMGGEPPSPELRSILIDISARYLNSIAIGDGRSSSVMVLWPEYEVSGKTRMTQGDVDVILAEIRARKWPTTENPLYNLKVEDVTVHENSAAVFFIKELKSGSEARIKIWLSWSGNAWLIVDDNLFGDDGYMTQALSGKS